MKRKILKDFECMSGSGWFPDDYDALECPHCWASLENPSSKDKKIKCPECNKVLKIERGIQYMIRLK